MVMPNGQPCTKEDVVRIIGTDSSGSTDWLNVLIENKVCEVREDGAIYSRRMVKDNLISENLCFGRFSTFFTSQPTFFTN